MAGDLSAATGRSVGYVDIPPAAANAALLDAGLPPFVADQLVAVFGALRDGAQGETTNTVQSITGRPARPFAIFSRNYASAFRGAATARRTERWRFSWGLNPVVPGRRGRVPARGPVAASARHGPRLPDGLCERGEIRCRRGGLGRPLSGELAGPGRPAVDHLQVVVQKATGQHQHTETLRVAAGSVQIARPDFHIPQCQFVDPTAEMVEGGQKSAVEPFSA